MIAWLSGVAAGRTFACFMRIAQCVSAGVPIVAEAGDDPEDPLEALVTRLGGVHLVRFDDLVDTVQGLLASGRTALTHAQRCAWSRLQHQLGSWDGSASALQALLDAG